ncbi:hypothetical protein PBY51_002779 [Eleginops maclovinus]|uniref:Uncharacterized protein n=1 Tax=Eleginops maclovinus TaxID=56733 RepID=A0AAN8ADF8_ELEMC|nr:hypothetical protein PBY51_002779 [Eleginops maclovinus]
MCVELQTVPLCARYDQTPCFLSCHQDLQTLISLCHFVPGAADGFPSDIITPRWANANDADRLSGILFGRTVATVMGSFIEH